MQWSNTQLLTNKIKTDIMKFADKWMELEKKSNHPECCNPDLEK